MIKRWGEVIKGADEKREFRALTLPNALQAFLVSDPDSDKV